jgi:hypothetical protein
MGCGSSLTRHTTSANGKTPSTSQTDGKSTGKVGHLLLFGKGKADESSSQARDENLEPMTLVTLDDFSKNNDAQLRSIVDHIRCFRDREQCETYLSHESQSTSVFFIIGSEHVTQLISHIHQLPHIKCIYISQTHKHSGKDPLAQQWTRRYDKVSVVCQSDRARRIVS